MDRAQKAARLVQKLRLRWLLEENLRLVREENSKKRETFLSEYVTQRLAIEERLTRFNLCKLNAKWMTIMTRAKVESLKTHFELLHATFTEALQAKNNLAEEIGHQILEADEQFRTIKTVHMQLLDYLAAFHAERLDKFFEDINDEVNHHKEEYAIEATQLVGQERQEMDAVTNCLIAMDNRRCVEEEDDKLELCLNVQDSQAQYSRAKLALKADIEGKVEELWVTFRRDLYNYNLRTRDRRELYEALKINDDKLNIELRQLSKKIVHLKERLAQARSDMCMFEEDHARNMRLRETVREMCLRLKAKREDFKRMRAVGRERMIKLAIESKAVLQKLVKQKERGTKIIRLSQVCRKLELEEEKVLPFYASSLTKKEQSACARELLRKPQEPLAAALRDYASMENFWKRFNKVLMDRTLLEQERRGLKTENQHLRVYLKDILARRASGTDAVTAAMKSETAKSEKEKMGKGPFCRQKAAAMTVSLPLMQVSQVLQYAHRK